MEIKDWRRLQVRFGALLLATTTAFGPAAHAAGPRVDFNIPAGDAESTLLKFYVQSGVQVLYLAQAVENLKTRAVSGHLEASEALAKLLEGTGLVFEFESDTTAVVHTPSPAGFGAGGAAAPAPSEQTTPKTYASTPPGAYGNGPKDISEVTVTGTHIRGVLDVMSPLEVITKDEMKLTAYASVQDAIQTLPLNSGAAQSEDFGGTGNFNRGSALNLRGLGPGATLVLVNGHRQPQAGIQADFVDVSSIPWSAVDRIEVLPDGTSALYGSDAIAGVVNIILRDRLDGGESQARLGTAPGGAAERLAAQLFGGHWATGSWLFGYQYSERSALAAADRSYAADTDKRELGGSNYSSFRSSPGNILDPLTLQPVYAIPAGQDGTHLTAAQLLPGAVNLQNRFETVQLLPDRTTHSAYFTLKQNIGERIELTGEARYSQRSLTWQGSPDERIFIVPASNPFFVDPFGGRPFVIVAYNFLNDLGPLTGAGTTRSYHSTVGIKADLTETWQATLNASYGREDMGWLARNLIDVSGTALNAALANPDPALAFNPFGDGSANNAAVIDAIRGTQRSEATSQITTLNLVADGPLFDLPSGTARLALGSESRQEDFDRTLVGRDLIYRPQKYGRRISAAFAELSIPLVGDPVSPKATPRVELSAAGRYEKYSDFGTTFNPKIGVRWAPFESLKLRSSWGTSFRAPKLIDLYDVSQNRTSLVILPDPLSPSGQSITLIREGSNEDLNEERASTWTVGVDVAPASIPGFTVSLTAYEIEYNDQVIQPSGLAPFDILNQEDRWAEVITRNPSRQFLDSICRSPDFFGSVSQCLSTLPAAYIDTRLRNLASTQTKGIDMSVNHSFKTAAGEVHIGITGNYTLSFKQAFTDTSPVVDIVDTATNPLALRVRSTLDWSQHGQTQPGFGLTVATDYRGAYRDNTPLRREISDWITIDLRLNYRTHPRNGWSDNIELGFNAVNALDRDPPFVDLAYGYDYINADPIGRVVSFYMQKRWGNN